MNRSQLLEIIQNGENSGVEFKQDSVDNRSIAKELVALANGHGGHLFLGVGDNSVITGITRPKLEEWIMTACRDKIRPEIIPYFEIIKNVETGKDVAVIRVEKGWTVHHLWHNNHRTYYIRVGSQSREASWEELERLGQQRGRLRAEIRPVSGSGLNDLDMRRLEDYFGRVRGQEIPHYQDKESWKSLLINTEILSDETESASCTIAGLLLFGKKPHKFLPQSVIDANAFPGDEKDYIATERNMFKGPLTGLFRKNDNELEVIDPGLTEQAVSFIKRNTVSHTELKHGTILVQKPVYPVEVIREAVVNALVHRDYLLSSTDVEMCLYKNRLEIISPGRLPNGITPERMKAGCRAARNQLIKDILRDYGYMEHMGMGIPRKIIKGMKIHNNTEPDLIADEEQFTLRLYAAAIKTK